MKKWVEGREVRVFASGWRSPKVAHRGAEQRSVMDGCVQAAARDEQHRPDAARRKIGVALQDRIQHALMIFIGNAHAARL